MTIKTTDLEAFILDKARVMNYACLCNHDQYIGPHRWIFRSKIIPDNTLIFDMIEQKVNMGKCDFYSTVYDEPINLRCESFMSDHAPENMLLCCMPAFAYYGVQKMLDLIYGPVYTFELWYKLRRPSNI